MDIKTKSVGYTTKKSDERGHAKASPMDGENMKILLGCPIHYTQPTQIPDIPANNEARNGIKPSNKLVGDQAKQALVGNQTKQSQI